MTKKLSPEAIKLIDQYISLQIAGKSINCPYFNNRKARIRGALRVYAGKGHPSEIAEETRDLALKAKIKLKGLDDKKIKQFMIDHNLGIDCSGFVYHVLSAELKVPLSRHLKFIQSKNPLRKMLANLRPAENTSVSLLINDKNSRVIKLKNIEPGDLITWSGAGSLDNKNHVILIESVTNNGDRLKKVGCAHSLAWSTDGKYNHGVRRFKIYIADENRSLLDQEWRERKCTGDKNETFKLAKSAKNLEIRRIKTQK